MSDEPSLFTPETDPESIIEQLREALEPFARVPDNSGRPDSESVMVTRYLKQEEHDDRERAGRPPLGESAREIVSFDGLKLGDFRRARAALAALAALKPSALPEGEDVNLTLGTLQNEQAFLEGLYRFLHSCWEGTGRSYEDGSASYDYHVWREKAADRLIPIRAAIRTLSLPRTDSGIEPLRDLSERATPGEWEVFDGSSWRRIGVRHGDDCAVLYPTNHRHDRHPDFDSRDGRLYDNLAFIVACVNFVRAALERSKSGG